MPTKTSAALRDVRGASDTLAAQIADVVRSLTGRMLEDTSASKKAARGASAQQLVKQAMNSIVQSLLIDDAVAQRQRTILAQLLANPPRAMLYAGETVDCALWETVLRDVVPEKRPPHGVEVPPVLGYRIARLRIKRAAPVLDLGRLGVRLARWCRSEAARSHHCPDHRAEIHSDKQGGSAAADSLTTNRRLPLAFQADG